MELFKLLLSDEIGIMSLATIIITIAISIIVILIAMKKRRQNSN